jgi:hypothetical protein
MATKDTTKNGIEGEGSYSGTRAYNKATEKFVKDGKVDKAAKDAARALDSAEGDALKDAEAKGAAGHPVKGR